METFAFSESDTLKKIESGQKTGALQMEGQVRVWFYPHAVIDEDSSQKEGYPVYKDSPYFGRRGKGERDFMTTPATDKHRREFPQEWAQYEAMMSNPTTSIRALPRVMPSQIRLLEEFDIHFIEQLAVVESVSFGPPDQRVTLDAESIPILAELKALAVKWLALANVAAIRPKTEAEILRERIAQLEQAHAPKKRGRPKGSRNHVKDAQAAA